MPECSVHRLRMATLIVSAAFSLIFLLLVASTDVVLSVDEALRPLSLMGFFLVGGWLACRKNTDSRAGNAGAAFGVILAVGALGAATSMLVLRWRFPQADALLAGMDAAFGLDVRDIIAGTAARKEVADRLWLAYSNSIVYLIYAIPALGLLGKQELMWRTTFVYVGSLATICLLSGLVPAKGAFLELNPDLIRALPSGAGIYAFRTFDTFYTGVRPELSFATLNGVACFPSFHTAAALIMTMVWWPIRILRLSAVLWCIVVVFSTIPMGGHYVIDLVGGSLIFVIWVKVAEAAARGIQLPWLSQTPVLEPAA